MYGTLSVHYPLPILNCVTSVPSSFSLSEWQAFHQTQLLHLEAVSFFAR